MDGKKHSFHSLSMSCFIHRIAERLSEIAMKSFPLMSAAKAYSLQRPHSYYLGTLSNCLGLSLNLQYTVFLEIRGRYQKNNINLSNWTRGTLRILLFLLNDKNRVMVLCHLILPFRVFIDIALGVQKDSDLLQCSFCQLPLSCHSM